MYKKGEDQVRSIKSAIAKEVRKKLIEKQVTPRELSAIVDCTPSHISNITNMHLDSLSLPLLISAATYLSIPIYVFVNEQPRPYTATAEKYEVKYRTELTQKVRMSCRELDITLNSMVMTHNIPGSIASELYSGTGPMDAHSLQIVLDSLSGIVPCDSRDLVTLETLQRVKQLEDTQERR